MKVGIIGSGGREHAICQSIKNSKKVRKIFCFPGNAGTGDTAENATLELENFEIINLFAYLINFWMLGPLKSCRACKKTLGDKRTAPDHENIIKI